MGVKESAGVEMECPLMAWQQEIEPHCRNAVGLDGVRLPTGVGASGQSALGRKARSTLPAGCENEP
jgi:hypothetical protein